MSPHLQAIVMMVVGATLVLGAFLIAADGLWRSDRSLARRLFKSAFMFAFTMGILIVVGTLLYSEGDSQLRLIQAGIIF